MVGVSLALYLGNCLPEEARITLVESFPLPASVPGNVPEYHPSFDARSTALSYGSRLIYEEMGVWQDLQQWLCAIESIHVSSRGHFGSTLLQAKEYDWPALGYVLENAWLGNALIQALYRQGRAQLRSPAKVVDVSPADTGVVLQLEENGERETIQAGLLLVADGAGSGLREALGVAVEEKPYEQHALIANIATCRAACGLRL